MTKPKLIKVDSNYNFKDFSFNSNNSELEKFLFDDASEFIKESYCKMYLFEDKINSKILGYITLNCSYINNRDKKISSIPNVINYIPGVLIGRLAVDKNIKRTGYGTDLIKKATKVSIQLSQDIGCRVLIVDAITTKEAIDFYLRMGFDFVDTKQGNSIITKLEDGKEIKSRNVKMYLDLYKLIP